MRERVQGGLWDGRMSGAVGLRCANPTYAVCICVDHT